MKESDLNVNLVEGYMRLLNNLSSREKLDLIAKLTQSVKNDVSESKSSFYQAFGAWDSEQSAEQLINDIRSSRSFNRQIEEL